MDEAGGATDMSSVEDNYHQIAERVHGLFPGLRRRGIYDIVVKEKGDVDRHLHPTRSSVKLHVVSNDVVTSRILRVLDKAASGQSLVPREAAERAFQGPAAAVQPRSDNDEGKGKERVHKLEAQKRDREIAELIAMFPALPRSRIEATYDAHQHHLGPSIDHLLQTAVSDGGLGHTGHTEQQSDTDSDADASDDDSDGDSTDESEEEENQGLKQLCMEYVRQRWGLYADQLHRLTPEVAQELRDHVGMYMMSSHAPAAEHVELSAEEERAREDLNSVLLFAFSSSSSPSPSSRPSSTDSSSSSSSSASLPVSSGDTRATLKLSREGVSSSASWMAEWEEMERRDEELARALQREEEEQAAKIERQDEQLARLIVAQERRQHALRLRRQRKAEACEKEEQEEAWRRLEAQRQDEEYARTLQQQLDAEKLPEDAEVERMMQLMEEEDASMGLIRELLGEEKRRTHPSAISNHRVDKLMTNSDEQLCEKLFAGSIDTHMFGLKVLDIKRVLQVELVRRFMAKWIDLRNTHGSYAEEARPRLGFHGTPQENIPSILQKGLQVPGSQSGIRHLTDTGFYGAGIYLSPHASTSLAYAHGCGKLLVCAVLMGRIYECKELMHGSPCVDGFDSHMSPGGEELILFEAAQVLPCFVLTIDAPAPRPYYVLPSPAPAPTQIVAKKAAKAKGGRKPKAKQKKNKKKLKLERRLAKRR